jgi:hypothetical protein
MGRKPKDWDLFQIIALFEAQPDRALTYRDLYRAMNGNRYPKRIDFALKIMSMSGYFIFRPCDPKKLNDKKEIVYMPSYREAAEREVSGVTKDVVTPAGTGTNGSN